MTITLDVIGDSLPKLKNDFHASEMLFEEHIKGNVTGVPDGLEEMKIVPPRGRKEQENNDNGNESHEREVEEPEMPGNADNTASSSDDYETAGSSGSETESDVEQEALAPVANEPGTYRTRSGRAMRPPVRYGWNH